VVPFLAAPLGDHRVKTDLTFITNEESKNLLQRFGVLIKDTRLFDALVGYFYTRNARRSEY
jgi:hypothetical protein